MADFYAALRRQNGAAPLADFATALNTKQKHLAEIKSSRHHQRA